MKKKVSLLLVFALILSLLMTGCNNEPEVEEVIEEIIISSVVGNTEQTPNSPNVTSSTSPTSSVAGSTSSNSVSTTTPQVTKPTGPNVPVLNCGFPTDNPLEWAQKYGKEMVWGQSYNVASDLLVARIRPISLYGTYALKHQFEGGQNYVGIRGSHAYVDFQKNEIGFKDPKTTSTILTSKKCSFKLVAKREYIVEHTVIGGHILTFTITDTVDNKKDTVVYDEEYAAYFSRSSGIRTDEYSESQVEVLSRKVYSLQPYNPQVLILGDSFVADFYGTSYSHLIANKLNGSAFLNGISGGSTPDIRTALKYLPDICQPKYVVLAVGTNQKDFDSWQRDMIFILDQIKTKFNGATPILATITQRDDTYNGTVNNNTPFVTKANDWIRSSGYKYVDINKLTTVGGDMKTWDSSKFQSDKIHLTPKANEEVYNSFLNTVPELFK